jgi:hypothetical protein
MKVLVPVDMPDEAKLVHVIVRLPDGNEALAPISGKVRPYSSEWPALAPFGGNSDRLALLERRVSALEGKR